MSLAAIEADVKITGNNRAENAKNVHWTTQTFFTALAAKLDAAACYASWFVLDVLQACRKFNQRTRKILRQAL